MLLLDGEAEKSSWAQSPTPASVWGWDTGPDESGLQLLTAAGATLLSEAAVYFTSGSTSRPKPVLHTHATLLWTARKFVLPLGATTTLAFLPNFHVIMSFQNFMMPLVRGVGVAVHGADTTEPITSTMLLSAAAALRPTIIDTVPFIMTDWAALPASDLAPLAACAFVQSGGAPLAVGVATRLREAGVNARSHYGQTEAPGIQLVSVPGARPDELSYFLPPWDCVTPELDGDGEEGELLLKGLGNSALGYLKEGDLVPGSSRKRPDPDGRHATGDVFRWVTLANGTRALKHSMRVDDTILLSTGEMFNPVPIEAAIETHALEVGLKVQRLVVLGQNRPMPFLVVELSAAETRKSGEALELLQPGIDAANAAEVEYARLRPGYTLVVSPLAQGDEELPHSAKGNVIRAQAERALAEDLDDLAAAAASSSAGNFDWVELRAKAEKAGYDDVDAYLASPDGASDVASIGVDSLGVVSVQNPAQVEAERVGDNVKTWMLATVCYVHWYVMGGFGSQVFTSSVFSYKAQLLLAMNSCIVQEWTSFSLSMCALLLCVGWTDGLKDNHKPSWWGRREMMMVLLLLLHKCLFIPLMGKTYDTTPDVPYGLTVLPAKVTVEGAVEFVLPWRTLLRWSRGPTRPPLPPPYAAFSTLSLSHHPLARRPSSLTRAPPLPSKGELENTDWYLYTLLWGKSFMIICHKILRLPPWFISALALANALVRQGITPYDVGGSTAVQQWTHLLFSDSYALNDSFGFPADVPSGSPTARYLQVWDAKITCFVSVYILAFYYMDDCAKLGRRLAAYLGQKGSWRAALALGVLAVGMNGVYAQLWVKELWQDRPMAVSQSCYYTDGCLFWSLAGKYANWALVPLYNLIEFGVCTAMSALVLGACAAAPYHSSRIGSNALGIYLLMDFWPLLCYWWLYCVVSAVGSFGVQLGGVVNFALQALLLALLLAWPYVYMYFLGPVLTAVVQAPTRTFFWLYEARSLGQLRADAAAYVTGYPRALGTWWAEYVAEARTDKRRISKAMAASRRRLCAACFNVRPKAVEKEPLLPH